MAFGSRECVQEQLREFLADEESLKYKCRWSQLNLYCTLFHVFGGRELALPHLPWGASQSDWAGRVLCLAISLIPPQLLTVLGSSSGSPSCSCPHARCKLLPVQQLRVKVDVADCLRKEDLGWEEVLLQRKPRGCISKCPRFPFPSRMLL